MSVHTPGPWCQCEPLADHMQDSGSRRIHAHFDCDCKVAWFGGEPQKAHSRAIRYLPATDADAHLMAAAPEMLDFIRDLATQHAPHGEHKRCWACGLDGDCCGVRHRALSLLSKAGERGA